LARAHDESVSQQNSKQYFLLKMKTQATLSLRLARNKNCFANISRS